jgi:ribosomal protein S18 acetylase RimI-like enzyme
VEPVNIQNAAKSYYERVIKLMTLAFVADPACRWLYRDADVYIDRFPEFTRAFGGQAFEHDTAFVTEDLSGASLWFPPGEKPDAESIESMIKETTPEDAQDDIFSAFEQMDTYHPEEPHWYLAVIGVDPSRQGHGVGSTLLNATLTRVDEEGLPAYLESSNPANISLYERHGFEVQGEIRGGADGPPITPMYRRAR